jgi:hypothetical protein
MQRIQNNKKVEIVDDERASGNGVIVTLKAGWSFDPHKDNRVRAEDTASEMLAALALEVPFGGELDR